MSGIQVALNPDMRRRDRTGCGFRVAEILIDHTARAEEYLCKKHADKAKAQWRARARAAEAAYTYYDQRKLS